MHFGLWVYKHLSFIPQPSLVKLYQQRRGYDSLLTVGEHGCRDCTVIALYSLKKEIIARELRFCYQEPVRSLLQRSLRIAHFSCQFGDIQFPILAFYKVSNGFLNQKDKLHEYALRLISLLSIYFFLLLRVFFKERKKKSIKI